MQGQPKTDRGASLVGVLVVLVILGALAALAVAALPDDPSGTSGPTRALEREASGPGDGGGRPASAAAATTACQANVRSVEAAATERVADGLAPSSVAELVTGGWLSEAPTLQGYELTMEMAGGHATGRVLVNGLPADQGCAAPPRRNP